MDSTIENDGEAIKNLFCHFFPDCSETFATPKDLAKHLEIHKMNETKPSFNFFDDIPLQTPKTPAFSSTWIKDKNMTTDDEKSHFNERNSYPQKLPLNEITNVEQRKMAQDLDSNWSEGAASGYYSRDSSLGILNFDNMRGVSFEDIPTRLSKESKNSSDVMSRSRYTLRQGITNDTPLQVSDATYVNQNDSKSHIDKLSLTSNGSTFTSNDKTFPADIFVKKQSNSNTQTPKEFLEKTQSGSYFYKELPNTPAPFNKLLRNDVASSTYQNSCTPSKIGPFADASSFLIDDIFKNSFAIQKGSILPDQQIAPLEDSKPFNKLPQNAVASSTFQDSCTPSKMSSFADASSILDEVFKNSSEIQKGSILPDQHVASLEDSKISFCIDQISGRSSSISSVEKEKLGKLRKKQENQRIFFDETNNCDFEVEKQTSDFSNECFDNDAVVEEIDEYEREIEKERIIDIQNELSAWINQSSNQFVKRPSWWDENTTGDNSLISASRFLAARAESIDPLGVGQENEEKFLFSRDGNSFKNTKDYYHDETYEKSTKDTTGKCLEQDSDKGEQKKKIPENDIIDLSTISKLISDFSLSDNLSVIAKKFLTPSASHVSSEKTAKVPNIVEHNTYKINSGQNNQMVPSAQNIKENAIVELSEPDKGTNNIISPPSCNVLVETMKAEKHVSKIYSPEAVQPTVSPSNNGCLLNPGSTMAVNLDTMNYTKISSVSSQESSCSSCGQVQQCFLHRPKSCSSACSNVQQPCVLSMRSQQCLNAMSQPPNFNGATMGNAGLENLLCSNFATSANMDHIFSRTFPQYPHPYGLSGFPLNSVVIIGPTEIIQPVMCLGDKQKKNFELKNLLNVSLYYHFTLTSATLNGESIAVDSVGVTIPSIISVSAAGVASVTVEFLARILGKFKLTLQIVPSFSAAAENSFSAIGASLIVSIFFETEEPHFSLLHEGRDRLYISSVLENNSVSKTVTLCNHGKASVPLKLDIHNGQEGNHSFDFDVKEMKSKYDGSDIEWLYVSPHTILCRLYGTLSSLEPRKVEIPVTFHAGRCIAGTEQVFGMIIATIESVMYNFMANPSERIKASAIVGTVKISIVHPNKFLTIKAEENSKSSCLLRIVNTGSLSAVVDLAVHCDSEGLNEEFYILPPTVELDQNEEVTINVCFKPSSSQNVKGVIQAAMQNDGEVFDLMQVEGIVMTRNYMPKHSSYRKTSMPKKVLAPTTDKKFLVWGGVIQGEHVCRKLTVRNPSFDVNFKANVFIKDKEGNIFQIIDDNGDKLEKLHLELKPNMQKEVNVLFSPRNVKVYCGLLVMKPEEPAGSYTIPLSGYGGLSHIEFRGLQEKDKQAYVQLLFLKNEEAFVAIKLINTGSRAAYVAVIGNLDLPTEEIVFSIQPNKFILRPSREKIVSVKLLHLKSAMCALQEGHRCGQVIFYYGDEILRQKIKNKQYKSNEVSDRFVQRVNFEEDFKDENKVPIDTAYSDSPEDVPLFYNSMKTFKCNINFGKANLSEESDFTMLSLKRESF